MDRDFLIDLFAPFGPVTIRRMFSGFGISADGVTFALVIRDAIYLRTDADGAARRGSRPRAAGRSVTTPAPRRWRSAHTGCCRSGCSTIRTSSRNGPAPPTPPPSAPRSARRRRRGVGQRRRPRLIAARRRSEPSRPALNGRSRQLRRQQVGLRPRRPQRLLQRSAAGRRARAVLFLIESRPCFGVLTTGTTSW